MYENHFREEPQEETNIFSLATGFGELQNVKKQFYVKSRT